MMKKLKLSPVQRDLLKKENRIKRMLSAKKRKNYRNIDPISAYSCLLLVGIDVDIESNPFVLERFLKALAFIKRLAEDRETAFWNGLWDKAHDPEFMMYSGLKSCPHWETQCASSMAKRAIRAFCSQFRQCGVTSLSGAI